MKEEKTKNSAQKAKKVTKKTESAQKSRKAPKKTGSTQKAKKASNSKNAPEGKSKSKDKSKSKSKPKKEPLRNSLCCDSIKPKARLALEIMGINNLEDAYEAGIDEIYRKTRSTCTDTFIQVGEALLKAGFIKGCDDWSKLF